MHTMEQLWSRFLTEGGQPDATAFGIWLIREQPVLIGAGSVSASERVAGGEPKTQEEPVQGSGSNRKISFRPDGTPAGYQAMDVSVKAAILVGRLERFLHYLTKPSMKDAGMTEDEFVVLATLLYMPSVAKTQLLKQCLIEIPTGSELLKRMKRAGLILEKQNPQDGRSSYISISAKGKQHLFKVFKLLGGVEDALVVLSPAEKDDLLCLLDKLDLHHSRRHEIRQVSALMGGSQN